MQTIILMVRIRKEDESQKKIASSIDGFCSFWIALTIFVEIKGEAHSEILGKRIATQNALIIYNPDPIYNLDEEVCNSFAEGLAKHNWWVNVKTVSIASQCIDEEDDLYIFCANTYNFAPDRGITNFIKTHDKLNSKPVVAITLGSGPTERSKRILENIIKKNESTLLDSKTYWLLRPNDVARLEESNVTVAIEMANKFGMEVGKLKGRIY